MMVYYYTSKNIMLLKDTINDYGATKEISPCEYMKLFIEKCPETMEDTKISWIVETFLSIQKHEHFLTSLKSYISKELSDEDQDYFIIVFHAIVFQITPKNMSLLYKCLFNLSKPLLNIFTTFLSNNEVLTLISEIAQCDYDTNFITEKLIEPLYLWQPYIKDMAENYIQYVKKIKNQKIKQPTKPVTPKVLSRKIKTNFLHPLKESIAITPPNSIRKERKMLTKSVIDQKLKEIHEKNKQKALHLLQTAKNKNCHYAKENPETLQRPPDETKHTPKLLAKLKSSSTPPTFKETTTTLKRIKKRIQLSEKEELRWLEDLMINCRNTTKIEELQDYDRQEKERERLLDIERKHLLGQISYEEAVIAKKKLYDENKKKYEDFIKEKRLWEEEIERWKINEIEKNRKQVEKLSLIELDMLHAKTNNIAKKKEIAEKLRKESEEILSKAVKEKQEELDRKIKMIRELKILAVIAKQAKVPKIIDLTETSGLGLLCEMSIAELQEKLNMFKISLKEELDKKRENIKEQKLAAKNDLEETKKSIENYMSDRANLREKKKKSKNIVNMSSSQEINELKKILEEKRNLRLKLSC